MAYEKITFVKDGLPAVNEEALNHMQEQYDEAHEEIVDLAGAGRTTETIKQNADDIATAATALTRAQGVGWYPAEWYRENVMQCLDGSETWVDRGWHADAGTYSADLTNFLTGTYAAKCNTATNYGGIHVVKNLDFTKFSDGSVADNNQYIKWKPYVPDLTNVPNNGIFILFPCNNYSTQTDYYVYAVAKASLTTGWNHITVAKSAFSSIGTPDWSAVKGISVALAGLAVGATEFTVDINSIQMVKKDPDAAVPNQFQRMQNGVATRDFAISSGEWYVGMENGELVCKLISNPVANASLLIGTQAYTDFTARGEIKGSSATARRHLTWHVDDNNKISAYIVADTLYLSVTEGGSTVSNSRVMSVAANNPMQFEVSKYGSSVSLIAYRNNDRNNGYSLKGTTTLTSAGYLAIGGSVTATDGMAYYNNFSITTTEYAAQAGIAAVAKTFAPKFKAGAFTAAELNFGELGIDTTNHRIYYLETAGQVRYLSGT
jgi:hypothetical protein